MNLKQLETFVMVAHEENLTRASDILCLSQPAISAQLKALEDELGLQLFARVSRGMELTDAGKLLIKHAEQVLKSVQHVSIKAKSLRTGISGLFSIGTIASPSILRVEQTANIVTTRHPDLRLNFVQGISGDVVDWVLARKVEAGYVIGQLEESSLVWNKIAPVTLRVVAPHSWGSKISCMDWSGIATLPWISTPKKCSFYNLANRMFTRHRVNPQIVIEADQEQTLLGLVSSGIGLTLLREDIALSAQALGDVVIWEQGIEVSHVYFIYRQDNAISSKLQAVNQAIKEVFSLNDDEGAVTH